LKRYVAPAVVILAVCVAVLSGAFERLELGLYDYWFKLRGEQPPGDEILIVAIDEKSIEKIGSLPFPRSVHAHLLDILTDARVVGFDLLFDVPGDPAMDSAFSGALERHGHVVLASTFKYESEGGQWYQKLLSPAKPFAAGSAGIGFINMPENIDGVIRDITAVDINTFKRPYPCLGLAVALAYDGLDPNSLRLAGPGVLQAGDRALPVDSSNKMLLSFWGGANTFKTLSYADVLAGNIPPGEFKDKIVLVGNTSPLVKDDFRTPFSSSNLVLSGKLPTPGVEVHANAVKTILDGVPYRRASTAVNLAILIFSGAIVTAAVGRRGPWVSLGFVLLFTGALAAATYLTWLNARLWLNMAAPATLIVLLYTSMTLQGFLSAEKERRRTRAMFGRYVSPAVMEELLKNPDLSVPGGQRREVTILFTDIRDLPPTARTTTGRCGGKAEYLPE
jgi:adenylate cyclase